MRPLEEQPNAMADRLMEMQTERDQLRAEVDRLKAENKELAAQEGRQFGRQEAAAILLEVDPEDMDDLIGSRSIADTGDYESYWKQEAVLKLFEVGELSSSLEHYSALWFEYHSKLFELKDAAEKVLDSASPHPTENPKMFLAFDRLRGLLGYLQS